jgi:hypothetical protein
MKFAVSISVTGIPGCRSNELDYETIKQACERVELDITEGEPGESEYTYIAMENYDCNFMDGVEWDCEHTCCDAACFQATVEKHRRKQCKIHGIDPDNEPFWWQWGWEARDFRASGILNKGDFWELVNDTGMIAEDIETLGTLGGPADMAGWVPDINFRTDSQILIECIRVTPLPDRVRESRLPISERDWLRLRKAMLSVFC